MTKDHYDPPAVERHWQQVWTTSGIYQTDLAQSRILFEQATANRAVAARNLAVARLRVQLLSDLPLQLGASSTASTSRQ